MNTHPDLFGGETAAYPFTKKKTQSKYQSKYQIFKSNYNYKKSESKIIRCGNCKHHFGGGYHGKTYHKCEQLGMSHSRATDIRVGHVCDLFKKVE